jgi:hypothetical protein
VGKIPVRKFRYSLIYAVDGGSVLVLAVAHGSRRPEYWSAPIDDLESNCCPPALITRKPGSAVLHSHTGA